MLRSCSIVFLLTLCFACSKPLPQLKGIDLRRWQQDKNGCNRERAPMRAAIDHEKEKLLGLDEIQTITLLGGPDQNELYSRNQKFYYYFIEPAPLCPAHGDSAPAKLVIRFNAMGLAKEVSIE